MVLYDDKKWLCRLIRKSFTMEDSSGVSEKVLKEKAYLGDFSEPDDSSSISSDDSFDIRDAAEMGYRQRLNTEIRLEKMDRQQKAQTSTRYIRACEVDVKLKRKFEPNEDYKTDENRENVTDMDKLLKCVPHPDEVPFHNYAKYDVSGYPPGGSQTMSIFITFLTSRSRNYPIKVTIVSTAKVLDLIGLTLWLVSRKHPKEKLHAVHEYNLQIADEDGEWDLEFPPLSHEEPIGKFSFSHLALVAAYGQSEQSKQIFNFTFLLPNAGELKIPLADPQTKTLQDALKIVLEKANWRNQEGKLANPNDYHAEKLGTPSTVFRDLTIKLTDTKCREFCIVRNGSKSIQRVIVHDEANSSGTDILGHSELYPVTVHGRFNRIKNALCIIWGRERMDLEFQNKTKSYPFSHISHVKLDTSKNRVVVSLSSHLGMGTATSHLQLVTSDIGTASALHNRIQSIIDSCPKYTNLSKKDHFFSV